jgi:hypothetical protein
MLTLFAGSLGIAVILNKRRRGFCMNREKGSKKSVLFREILCWSGAR